MHVRNADEKTVLGLPRHHVSTLAMPEVGRGFESILKIGSFRLIKPVLRPAATIPIKRESQFATAASHIVVGTFGFGLM